MNQQHRQLLLRASSTLPLAWKAPSPIRCAAYEWSRGLLDVSPFIYCAVVLDVDIGNYETKKYTIMFPASLLKIPVTPAIVKKALQQARIIDENVTGAPARAFQTVEVHENEEGLFEITTDRAFSFLWRHKETSPFAFRVLGASFVEDTKKLNTTWKSSVCPGLTALLPDLVLLQWLNIPAGAVQIEGTTENAPKNIVGYWMRTHGQYIFYGSTHAFEEAPEITGLDFILLFYDFREDVWKSCPVTNCWVHAHLLTNM